MQLLKMNHSLPNSSNAQATDSVSERTHTTKEDDIPSFIRNREERRSRRTRR